MHRIAIIASLALAAALPAQAFVATNSLVIKDAGPGQFEIPYRGLSGASDFWCAAGDYAIRGLKLAPGTRLYRTSSVPRRSGQGMAFSLSPEGAQPTGLVHWSRDGGMSAAHAKQLCEIRDFD